MKKLFIIVIIIVLILLISGVIYYLRAPKAPEEKIVFQKGMSYATWSKDAYGELFSKESLGELAATGTEWVAFVVTWYQDRYNSVIIERGGRTPSDESLIKAIGWAKELGLKVMLKPHLDLAKDIPGAWRGEIDHYTDEDWTRWFESYRDFVVHYARIAQERDVELFCVGTELTNPAVLKPELWKEIVIKDVKKVYQGLLTYAANWKDEYQDVEFWDELDFAGIDPYFPLSNEDKPSLEELKEAWKKYLIEIEDWQSKIEKPVIFTEIGYKSSTGAARAPWEHVPGRRAELELQANCYKALLETFWDKDWFYGVYWWYWGTNKRMGGKNHRGFLLQNKPVVEVLKEWYSKKRNP